MSGVPALGKATRTFLDKLQQSATIFASDLYCGAGGASCGLVAAALAMGFLVNIVAINHWEKAIETHQANFPGSVHMLTAVERVDPRKAIPGGFLHLLLAGPSCVHFSKSRGGLPVSDQQRSGAWDIIRWCRDLYVARVLVENVEEFQTWGPLRQMRDKAGNLLFDEETGKPLMEPCPDRKGMYFRQWVRMMESMGYKVEWRVCCAADYGDATTRKRLFIQCRRDGSAIKWPIQTHYPPELLSLYPGGKAWVAAKEIIDWNIQGANIFTRNKKMAIATQRRIYAGLAKFHGLVAVPVDPQYRVWFSLPEQSADKVEPISLVPAAPVKKKRSRKKTRDEVIVAMAPKPEKRKGPQMSYPIPPFILLPAESETSEESVLRDGFLVQFTQTGKVSGGIRHINSPMFTITTKQEHAIVQPFLVNLKGQSTASSILRPTPTITAHAQHLYLAEPGLTPGLISGHPFLVPNFGEHAKKSPRFHDITKPLPTVTSHGAGCLVQPFIVPNFSSQKARSIERPLGTITTNSRGVGLAQASVSMHPSSYDEPVRFPSYSKATENEQQSLVPFLVKFYGGHTAATLDDPIGTVTASYEHYGLCQPGIRAKSSTGFLMGVGGPSGMQRPRSLDDPLPTILAQNSTGMVEVGIQGKAKDAEKDAGFLVRYQGGGKGRVQSILRPLTTQDTSNRFGIVEPRLFVSPYLVSYYGNGVAQSIFDPLATCTTHDRFGLAEPQLLSCTGAATRTSRHRLAILECLFRMLDPRELANSHSFDPNYYFAGGRGDMVRMVGNSWPVAMSTALCKVMIEDLPNEEEIEYLMRKPQPKFKLWADDPKRGSDGLFNIQEVLPL